MRCQRRWARRAALSALAGSGITAVGLTSQLPIAVGVTPTGGPARPGSPPAESVGPTITQTSSSGSSSSSTSESSSATSTTQTSASTGSSTESLSSSSTGTSSGTSSTQTSSSTKTSRTRSTKGSGSRGAPSVRGEQGQQATGEEPSGSGSQKTGHEGGKGGTPSHGGGPASGAEGNVAPPPQMVASQAEALASLLGTPAVSVQALDYYRIPMFLLPIYQAAAVQYGVPWQVLAAINEVETDYGSDLNVSSAGAVGWMQFMPETWLRYGVDVQEAGYADPYNPVDAIFAAARYLRAAGAAHDIKGAIFAYNHSQAYVESVLLRAKLIAHYPTAVIETLTGLAEGRLPVAHALATGEELLRGGVGTATVDSVKPVTATSTKLHSKAASSSSTTTAGEGLSGALKPGSTPAPTPAASAAGVSAPAAPQRFGELIAPAGAPVVAVQDGKIVALGRSRRLGRYVILRDVYGDVFTYAGLGDIAPTYAPPRLAGTGKVAGIVAAAAEATNDPAPARPASAGSQLPLTLHVRTPTTAGSGGGRGEAGSVEPEGEAGEGIGKVRVFARPDNGYAHAAIARARAAGRLFGQRRPLRVGSVISQGTVLGHTGRGPRAAQGSLRFAISPAGDTGTVQVQPVLESWRQLDAALHPRGAKRDTGLIGATAGDAFLLSRSALQRAVLSDPGIGLPTCVKSDVARGAIDTRALATLVFLSRSGLKPTVGALPCATVVKHGISVPGTRVRPPLSSFQIVKVNGVPIASHQGASSITDLTIRTLLTLQGKFAPSEIASLMHYPGSPVTIASKARWRTMRIAFSMQAVTRGATATAPGAAARAAKASSSSTSLLGGGLGALQWSSLMGRIGGIPQPQVTRKPSSAAISDRPAHHG